MYGTILFIGGWRVVYESGCFSSSWKLVWKKKKKNKEAAVETAMIDGLESEKVNEVDINVKNEE